MSQPPMSPVQVELLGERAAGVSRIALVLGIVGLILCIIGFITNRTVFFQSYLFAFLYWSGFAIGGLGILLLNNVVGGRWGVTTRRYLEALVRTLPYVFLLFLPILLGLPDIYPWARPEAVSASPALQHKAPYLNVPFFIARLLLYFLIWLFWSFRLRRLSDQQDETGDPTLKERMRAFSAPGLLVFVLTVTFGYIDWILSADNEFFSTVYGGMILIGDVLQAFAITVIVLILTSKLDRFGGRIHSKLLHDLGNLTFAFTIFWAYLSVSQLIVIWPGNLPQEIGWYLVRVRGGWTAVTAIIALSMFLIPFLAMLWQQTKQKPERLLRVCIWLLMARMIDLFWIVEPTYRTHGFVVYWTDFAAFIGVGGIWVFVYLLQLKQRPLLPLRDSRVSQPLLEPAL